MKVEKSRVVEIHFTLKNEKGKVIDTTQGEAPLTYMHGSKTITPGMEEAVNNLEVGSNFDADLIPEKAFGLVNPQLVKELPKENFPDDIDLKVGQQFTVETPGGLQTISIKELRKSTVLIDGNHELAGQTLNFSGTVVSVREATQAEIARRDTARACCGDANCSEHE